MFQSVKSRLAAVLSAAWIVGVFLFAPERRSDEYAFAVIVGLIGIVVLAYGAFWVIEGKGFDLKLNLPRWAGYVLIAVLAILIMGLPKAISF
jgi:hypothetical protein